MEIETRLTSTAAALDNSRPAQLTAAAVRQVSAVERVLPEEQATDLVAEELETSDLAIVPALDQALVRVVAPVVPAEVSGREELDRVVRAPEILAEQTGRVQGWGLRIDLLSATHSGVVLTDRVETLALQLDRAAAVHSAAAIASGIGVFRAVADLALAPALLAAPDLAVALRDQPAVEEVIAWAAVASAVEVVVAVVVAEAAEVEAEDKQRIESCGVLSAELIF